MSSEPERRFHTDKRTSENFDEGGLYDLTGQKKKYWARYSVKELLDNALDFSEETDRVPGIRVEIETEPGNYAEYVTRVLVADNGPGIPKDRLERICENIGSFGGTKRHYAVTTRGKQGNALMTLIGIQYLCGMPLRIATQGREYQIRTTEGINEYHVELEEVGDSSVEGTLVEVDFGEKAPEYGHQPTTVINTVYEFVVLNPHADFTVVRDNHDSDDETVEEYLSAEAPTGGSLSLRGNTTTTGKATWFSADEFKARLKADIDVAPALPIEDFVSEFCGISGREKRKTVLDTYGDFYGDIDSLDDLTTDNRRNIRDDALEMLHAVMCEETGTFGSGGLDSTIGSIGNDLQRRVGGRREDVYDQLREAGEADEFDGPTDLVVYNADGAVIEPDTHTSKTIPFYFELAAAPTDIIGEGESPDVESTFGVNQSVLYSSPRFGARVRGEYPLDIIYQNRRKDCSYVRDAFDKLDHDFTVVCNLSCPNVDFGDKGKQDFDTEPFTGVIETVVGKTVRKIESDIRPRLNAVIEEPEPEPEPEETLDGRADKSFIGDFISEHFWEIYNEATSNGRFSLTMRDFYYAIREPLLNEAKRRGYKYRWNSPVDDPQKFKFTQATSDRHVREFEEENIGHRLLERDDRGFFAEPHTGRHIPLGTAAVDNYDPTEHLDEYDALLYIEKTGRMDIIEQTEIAKEYDIGVVNGKGYPTTAARNLIDNIQTAAREADRDIPVFTVTDFDINGILIREDVKNPDELSAQETLNVEHLGLTLEDVEEYDLTSEPVDISGTDRTKLNNAYEEGNVEDGTYEFLTANDGQRVEINALSPVELIDYLEDKFEELGIEKVAPEDADDIKDKSFMNSLDFDAPDDIRADAITEAIGNWVMSHHREVLDPLSDDFDTDIVLEPCVRRIASDGTVLEPCVKRVVENGRHDSHPAAIGAAIGDDGLSQEVEALPRNDEEAAEEVYNKTTERLDDNPPEQWVAVARDVVDELHDEYGGNKATKYKRSVKSATQKHLSQNYDIEIHPKTTDTSGGD